jgi:hypothetical protein
MADEGLDDADAPSPAPAPPARKRRHLQIQGSGAAAAGLLFAVLFIWGFWVLDYQIPTTASDLEAFYQSSRGTSILIAGGYIVPFAGICFLWFLAASRHRISQLALREDFLLGTIQLCTGVLFVAMFFISAAASVASVAVSRISGEHVVDVPVLAGTMTAYGRAVLMIYCLRMAAVFMIATTTRASRAGLFPKWFSIVSYVASAVLMVVLTYYRGVVMVFPIWVGVCSGVLLFRRVAHNRRLAAA